MANHATLHLGDCVDVLASMNDWSVDCILTDPPYGVGENYRTYEDDAESLQELISAYMPHCLRIAKRVILTPGVKNMWLYPRPNHIGSFFYPSATGCNSWGFSCWQPILYYGKDPFLTARKGSRPDSFRSTERAEKNGHPCPKPIGQWTWLLNRCSFAGEKIVDPFMGSGTTGVACAANDRDFIGIEKDAAYFRIAEKRIRAAGAKSGTFLELFGV